MKNKANDTWDALFKECGILEEIQKKGYYDITSSQINKYREARLMSKYDYSLSRPEIFIDNRLAILPTSRGTYRIAKFDAYASFPIPCTREIKLRFPDTIQSIDPDNICNEAMAVNCAYAGKILPSFLGEDPGLLFPTVCGRMSSGKFDFNILNDSKPFKVSVLNSQIEIDAGFEGAESLALIEAKNCILDDFIIRQLYYPYRLWKAKRLQKKIRPVYMTYSNGVFCVYEYTFDDVDDYNSIHLVKQERYSLVDDNITLQNIESILEKTHVIEEPKLPFPQADKFERLINLCELLFQSEMTREQITTNYGFDPRQTGYYTSAGMYLGLIERKKKERETVFALSVQGREIMSLPYKTKQLGFVTSVLSHGPFKKALSFHLEHGFSPPTETVVEIMKDFNLDISGETYPRRASTVKGWVDWILKLTH